MTQKGDGTQRRQRGKEWAGGQQAVAVASKRQ